ncbi:DegT/DnrJ/EryC1/StrS family aminotransferase [Azospirillum sp. A23]|uniref:DegT/DnrJ/EryC1/StrS family aminotransferase n=1 Tax=Azospirillum sp. A23 TaxID=3160608 RepID=UPI0036F40E6B
MNSVINVWSYLEEYDALRTEILEAVDATFRSGRLILGERVSRFEADFAAYCGARFGIGVDNGTNAITLALRALGIKPGDEVITTANTAVPTVSAVVAAGAVPRFVDIDPATGLMDVGALTDALTEQTRAVVPVHLYGQCVDMSQLIAVARRHGLKVVEDCAQSHGATHHGRRCGALADASAFSFYPTKNLGAYGDGGLVTTDDDEVASRLRRLRVYGMESTYFAEEHGYNCRLDEVQAAILSVKLAHLDTQNAQRQALARFYDEALADTSLQCPVVSPGNEHVYHLYVVRHPERDRIMHTLKAQGINLAIHYPHPIHVMPAYRSLGYREGDLPVTEAAAKEVFSLPLYPAFTQEAQQRVCAALRNVVG